MRLRLTFLVFGIAIAMLSVDRLVDELAPRTQSHDFQSAQALGQNTPGSSPETAAPQPQTNVLPEPPHATPPSSQTPSFESDLERLEALRPLEQQSYQQGDENIIGKFYRDDGRADKYLIVEEVQNVRTGTKYKRIKHGHLLIVDIADLDTDEAKRNVIQDHPDLEVIKTNESLKRLIVRLKNPSLATYMRLQRELANSPDVSTVESDYLVYPLKAANDSFFGQQQGLTRIGATKTWDYATDCSGVKVAVIDSGVDVDHPDLKANTLLAESKDLTGIGTLDDRDSGHGSHVAGIIGAVGNNASGIAGICWTAKVIHIRVFRPNENPGIAILGEAIAYAVNNGAKVVNMSLTSFVHPQSPYNAPMALAERKGALLAVAAGNQSKNNDIEPHMPASHTSPNIISVAASTPSDTLASFSNFGSNVDIAAPGTSILSTYPLNLPSSAPGYEYLQGTSMAAPFVAGALAAFWAQDPSMSPALVKKSLLDSAAVAAGLSKIAGSRRMDLFGFMKRVPPKVATDRFGDMTFISDRLYEVDISSTKLITGIDKVVIRDTLGNVLGEATADSTTVKFKAPEGSTLVMTTVDQLGNSSDKEITIGVVSQKDRDKFLSAQGTATAAGKVLCTINVVKDGIEQVYNSVNMESEFACQKYCAIYGPLVLAELKIGTCGIAGKAFFSALNN
jgi:subtilisin family serine protease